MEWPITSKPQNYLFYVMKKSDYLKLPEVIGFTNWLSDQLSGRSKNSFRHSFKIEPKGKSTKIINWKCESIFNAFEQYRWPFQFIDFDSNQVIKGSSYAESENALVDLQNRLREAVDSGNYIACLKVCEMILKWGGVLGSERWGNKKILLELDVQAPLYLENVRKFFNSDCELRDSYKIDINGKCIELIMNAGFTKIYSLLCTNFIIYDGRVGAALGRLVDTYLNSLGDNRPTAVPQGLSFCYGKAKNPNVSRNPSSNEYKFMALTKNYPLHTSNNLKANWIIDGLNLDQSPGFSRQNNSTRAFEAALFMIGYRM